MLIDIFYVSGEVIFVKTMVNLAWFVLCSPMVPLLALTATTNKQDQEQIREALGLSNCVQIIVIPDRPNIFYAKYFRKGNDNESIEDIL